MLKMIIWLLWVFWTGTHYILYIFEVLNYVSHNDSSWFWNYIAHNTEIVWKTVTRALLRNDIMQCSKDRVLATFLWWGTRDWKAAENFGNSGCFGKMEDLWVCHNQMSTTVHVESAHVSSVTCQVTWKTEVDSSFQCSHNHTQKLGTTFQQQQLCHCTSELIFGNSYSRSMNPWHKNTICSAISPPLELCAWQSGCCS